jgi:hypothetical protein
LCANDLFLRARHLRKSRRASDCARDRCDHSIKVKEPFQLLLQNWYIQTPGFPNGVSIFIVCASPARKPHWFKSPPPRPRPSARISPEHHDAFGEVPNDALDCKRNFFAHRALAEGLTSRPTAPRQRLAQPADFLGKFAAHSAQMSDSLDQHRLDLLHLDDVRGLEIGPDAKVEGSGHDAMVEQGAG